MDCDPHWAGPSRNFKRFVAPGPLFASHIAIADTSLMTQTGALSSDGPNQPERNVRPIGHTAMTHLLRDFSLRPFLFTAARIFHRHQHISPQRAPNKRYVAPFTGFCSASTRRSRSRRLGPSKTKRGAKSSRRARHRTEPRIRSKYCPVSSRPMWTAPLVTSNTASARSARPSERCFHRVG